MTHEPNARLRQGALARGELPFRDNPFEELSPAALARVFEWAPQARRFLEGEADCLHVVGDCGMGKTTLLEQMRHRLDADGVPAPYRCVPVDGQLDLGQAAGGAVLLLDETDRLRRRALSEVLELLRRGGSRAVLAGHRPQLREVRRASLSALYLELRPLRSPDEVVRLLEARIALATGHDHHGCRPTPRAAQALLHHSRGNIQRCLELGYEIFEDLERPRAIEVADVEAAVVSLARARGDSEASR